MTPGRRDLDDAETLDWLRLIRSENVGPRTFKTLLDRYGSAGAALKALPGLARKASARSIAICSEADAEAEWLRARKMNVRFVALCEEAYPEALRAIDAPRRCWRWRARWRCWRAPSWPSWGRATPRRRA